MEFGLSAEQILLQDQVSRFLKEQVPLESVRKVAEGKETDKGVWSNLANLGIPGILIKEKHGGLGLTLLDAAVVAENLGYNVTPSPFLSTAVIAPIVLQLANKREDVLSAISAGEKRVGIAFSQAIQPQHESGIQLDGAIIEGRLLFAIDSDADYYLVADEQKAIYIVDVTSGGLEVSPLATVEKTRSTAELSFSRVKAEKISDDREVFHQAWNAALVVMAADTLGASQSALDQAVTYAGQREQFNRVIASFQAVKHMCAEMAAHLEPCRAMVWYSAHAFDEIPAEATMMACHTKAHLSEVGQFVTRTATEVHGGMGFTDLVGLHYWFKRAGFNRQMLGSPELLRKRAATSQNLCA
ncbi:MAG: acyl-CoA dehydrogenase [Gammaproteobacteria bacterium]|nr:acyl-CoA dehydrogenase [Gammaproteobacteria bacterium]